MKENRFARWIKRNKSSKKKGFLYLIATIASILLLGATSLLYIRYKAYILAGIVFLAGSTYVYFRYDAWFKNVPEEAYDLPLGIDRITLTPGEDFATERNISWRYNSDRESKLEYYKIDSLNSKPEYTTISTSGKDIVTRAGHAYYFHVALSDLEAGSNYKYRIISDKDTTVWKRFAMPVIEDTLRFIYIGDVQDPVGQVSDSLFNRLRADSLKYDFIAFGGDQIERPMDKYWNIWYKSLDDWAGTVPLIMTAGNHEYIKGLNKTLDSRWKAQHNYPSNGPKDFKGNSYYIDFPLMRIITLDSNILQWPDAIQQHRDWLKETLESAKQPWKVVMFHHGVHTVRSGRSHPVMKYIFASILEDNGADLVLQGHDHAYSRITTKVDNDTIPPMYVISCASPKFYRNGFDDVHDRLGSGIALYQTIDVTKDNLHYKSVQFDGTVYDDLIIKKGTDNTKSIVDNARHQKEIFNFDGFGKDKKGRTKREKYLEAVKERENRFAVQ